MPIIVGTAAFVADMAPSHDRRFSCLRCNHRCGVAEVQGRVDVVGLASRRVAGIQVDRSAQAATSQRSDHLLSVTSRGLATRCSMRARRLADSAVTEAPHLEDGRCCAAARGATAGASTWVHRDDLLGTVRGRVWQAWWAAHGDEVPAQMARESDHGRPTDPLIRRARDDQDDFDPDHCRRPGARTWCRIDAGVDARPPHRTMKP